MIDELWVYERGYHARRAAECRVGLYGGEDPANHPKDAVWLAYGSTTVRCSRCGAGP